MSKSTKRLETHNIEADVFQLAEQEAFQMLQQYSNAREKELRRLWREGIYYIVLGVYQIKLAESIGPTNSNLLFLNINRTVVQSFVERLKEEKPFSEKLRSLYTQKQNEDLSQLLEDILTQCALMEVRSEAILEKWQKSLSQHEFEIWAYAYSGKDAYDLKGQFIELSQLSSWEITEKVHALTHSFIEKIIQFVEETEFQ